MQMTSRQVHPLVYYSRHVWMQNHKYREGPTLQYARLATIILTQISKTTVYKPANEDVIAVMFV